LHGLGIGDAEWSDAEDLGHCMVAAKEVAQKVGLTEGYRLVVNEGPHGLQSVRYCIIHHWNVIFSLCPAILLILYSHLDGFIFT
jgi:hypothetical protein